MRRTVAKRVRSFADSATTAACWIFMMWSVGQPATCEYAVAVLVMGFVAFVIAAAVEPETQ